MGITESRSPWNSLPYDPRRAESPAVAAIRSARTIEMTGGHLSDHVPRSSTNFPYAGTLVIVSCPKGSQWEIGLSDVANPGKPPGSRTAHDDGPNGGHAEGGA
jgi:hypothetical protein